MELEWIKNWK